MINYTFGTALLGAYFGRKPLVQPPEIWYLGLSTTPINISGYGATEPIAPDYARLAIPNTDVYFNNTSMITNKKVLKFQKALSDWGTINYFFLTTTPTGAPTYVNPAFVSGGLTATMVVIAGSTVRIEAGGLNVNIDYH